MTTTIQAREGVEKESKFLLAGSIGMAVFLIAGILNQIPPDFRWFVIHQNLKNFSFLITGGIQILFDGFIFPSRYLDYFYTSIWAIAGFALGALGYWLCVKHWICKAIVILLVFVNTIFSGFILFLSDGFFVRPADEICQISVTDKLKIRVVGYSSVIDEDYYGYYFVLSSVDNGHVWKQVMEQSYDGWDGYPPPPDCEGKALHFGRTEQNTMWFWTDKNLSVSHDGGQGWRNWQSSCGVREACDYGHIISVTFDDPQHGRMQVYVPAGNSKEIISSDGGATWTDH